MKIGQLQTELIDLFQSADFPCITIQSGPGLGKTESVRYATSQCIHDDGLPYDLLILHPVGRDQSFVGGYPTIVQDAEGVHRATHIAYGELERLRDADRPLVCFVDDFGQCAPSTQAAFQQLIQERSFNGIKVSPFVRFVLATNRREDRAGVQQVLTTILGRSVVLEAEVDVDRLVQWLGEKYPDVPEVGAFLLKRPNFLTDPPVDEEVRLGALGNSPTPRAMEYVAKIRRRKRSQAVELELVRGAAGKAFASEFTGFCSIWKKLIPLREVLANPTGAKLPDAPHEFYAECGSLVHAATRQTLGAIAQYVNRFLEEYQQYFYKLVELQKPELCETTEYINFKTNSRY